MFVWGVVIGTKYGEMAMEVDGRSKEQKFLLEVRELRKSGAGIWCSDTWIRKSPEESDVVLNSGTAQQNGR